MPPALKQLLNYIINTWITSTLWPPASWSIYKRSIRTNNDVERWHRRLNNKVHRHSLPFSQLVSVLHSEASVVDTHAMFLNDDKLRRNQREKYRQQQAKIFELWDDFANDKLQPTDLLREVSFIYKPLTRT